jgi:hypothetical protein
MPDVLALNRIPALGAATPQDLAAGERSNALSPQNDRPEPTDTPQASDPSLAAATRLAIEHRHGRYIYTIYDPVTGQILQQIPDERLLEQRDAPADAAAVLLGVKV